ncbi:MAG: peptidoglycan-associated lipoprotein Pal [Hyphomicrobium sp.]
MSRQLKSAAAAVVQSFNPCFKVLLASAAALSLAACASESGTGPDSRLGSDYGNGYGNGGRYARSGANGQSPGSNGDFQVNAGDIVYFSSDSSDLTPEGQQTLSNQAQWLQQFSSQTITIEGHADERGTREYNIALGARRAESVKRYLAGQGVSAGRIRTVSYGKERPVAVCNDISCWSQNRRAQTVLNGGVAVSRR